MSVGAQAYIDLLFHIFFIIWIYNLLFMILAVSMFSRISSSRDEPKRILRSTGIASQRRSQLPVVDLGSNVPAVVFGRTRLLSAASVSRLPVWPRSQMETRHICSRLCSYVETLYPFTHRPPNDLIKSASNEEAGSHIMRPSTHIDTLLTKESCV